MTPNTIEEILDLARWAPSGDNTQPWRFEILSEDHFVVHGSDTRDWCVYDLQGQASQLALGALIENIAIAASGQGLRAEFSRRQETPETNPTIDVSLIADPTIVRDPLVACIKERVTQRRPLSTNPLSAEQKSALEASVSKAYSVTWVEGAVNRWRMARLLFRSAKIRLTIPEAFEVHKRIIEWDAQYSTDRIPDQAVGLDPVGLKLMRWAMKSWTRVDFLNRFMAGTWLPRLQLDLTPGYLCSAHFLLSSNRPLDTIDAYLDGGRAMQRLWLTSTQLGLQFQPEMTPLIFFRYAHNQVTFTERNAAISAAAALANILTEAFTADRLTHGVFMGRIGHGRLPISRSIRLSAEELSTTTS